MGYHRQNYIKIKKEYEGKALRAQAEAEARSNELGYQHPELRKIDAKMSTLGLRIMQVALEGGDVQANLQKVKQEFTELREARELFLEYLGYPKDYLDVKYACEHCKDSGYTENGMCSCMKKALIKEGIATSGLGNLLESQSFESFDLKYYREGKERDMMEKALLKCRQYAANFSDKKKNSNLLLFGSTGLGKTHLSTSIAKEVIERGCDVVYRTANNLFADFEAERFDRKNTDTAETDTERYFTCDLLIVDDLGTEITNQFTISCLYNLLDTRLNRSKALIFNTNLKNDELRKRYADRITSRLFGSFEPILFCGKDIREKKLWEN